jgi:hypothetical protein
MTLNDPKLAPLPLSTQEALRRSRGLIRQSDVLMAAAIAARTVKAQYDFLSRDGHSFLNWAVDSALQISGASKGNLQLVHPSSGVLHIVAQRGFGQPFLDFFNSVHTGQAACGKAFESCGRVIVEDVTESPIFYATSSLEVLLDARVRAVQSTPLVGSSGMILGIISTHWPSPRLLSNQTFVQLDVLARTVGRWLEHNRHA